MNGMKLRIVIGISAALLIALGAVLGTVVTGMVTAHGGDEDKIHACVGATGDIRIIYPLGPGVDSSQTCADVHPNLAAFTELDWDVENLPDEKERYEELVNTVNSNRLNVNRKGNNALTDEPVYNVVHEVVGHPGLEPGTSVLSGLRSNRLS